jgi:hypothetical protein
MLANALKPRVRRHDLDNATDAILAAVQGLQAAALPPTRQHQILRYALRKLTSSPPR